MSKLIPHLVRVPSVHQIFSSQRTIKSNVDTIVGVAPKGMPSVSWAPLSNNLGTFHNKSENPFTDRSRHAAVFYVEGGSGDERNINSSIMQSLLFSIVVLQRCLPGVLILWLSSLYRDVSRWAGSCLA